MNTSDIVSKVCLLQHVIYTTVRKKVYHFYLIGFFWIESQCSHCAASTGGG